MNERMRLPRELMLQTLVTRPASAHSPDNTIPQKLKDGGVSLKEIARTAAQAAERAAILSALQQTHWNRVRAAELLNISYRTLLYKIKGFGLHPVARAAQRRLGQRSTGQDPKAVGPTSLGG